MSERVREYVSEEVKTLRLAVKQLTTRCEELQAEREDMARAWASAMVLVAEIHEAVGDADKRLPGDRLVEMVRGMVAKGGER